ncbi:proline-, glutamic acid- and leucine-rich protein 1-like [Canis lupus familiaris]|uniref:proline-, glutamic acid- and leucine-rich protein 1-like n=1 Tax=Canis lupus familiaris TaxID=9615 RepID=UPI000BAA0837|nr:proline-, glutamic acid- and leucine-rich protein 1-like [Canis lupus familiaris]XP_025287661.1 proline-, glutamic acid- and leucine-rich protein 1-like [Canis lupus dingo]XP_048963610.1 proline-, glutamic acid- and leucine-rich protein 1-like [Canis lupus dingo]|eukprot:XP_022272059.1 proline-, glutamic acid- and leucine-rich protein 1-like [Canis lupus familiaris]
MSATEDPSLMPGGQDPRPLRVPLSPSEGVDGVRESAAFLASEGLSRALLEKEGGRDAAQAAEKIWDVEMLEEEHEGEVEEEEEEEEFDFEFGDQEVDEYQSPDFEYEFGNEEESESEEGEANEEKNEEEEEVIEQEEGNSQGQEHAEIAAGPPEAPMTRFWSLFRVLIHSLLHRIHDNDHVLVQPHTCCMVISCHSWEAQDRGEGPVPPDVEEPGRVLDQEHPREEAEVWVGEYQAEGSPP